MKYILIRDVLAKDHHWLSEDHRKGGRYCLQLRWRNLWMHNGARSSLHKGGRDTAIL
jgi:hypothetical protein